MLHNTLINDYAKTCRKTLQHIVAMDFNVHVVCKKQTKPVFVRRARQNTIETQSVREGWLVLVKTTLNA